MPQQKDMKCKICQFEETNSTLGICDICLKKPFAIYLEKQKNGKYIPIIKKTKPLKFLGYIKNYEGAVKIIKKLAKPN